MIGCIKTFLCASVIFFGGGFFSTHCAAQSADRLAQEIFPDQKFDPFGRKDVLPLGYLQKILNLSKEQVEFASPFFLEHRKLYSDNLHQRVPDEVNVALTRQTWSRFLPILTAEQLVKLEDKLFIDEISYQLSSETDWVSGHEDMPLQNLLSSKSISRWLGLQGEQKRVIQGALRQAEEKMEELEELASSQSRESALFAAWQKALYDHLLPFQQSSFDQTLGEKADYLKSVTDYSGRQYHVFLSDNEPGGERILTNWDPKLGFLLLLTPPHFDSDMHPHGLFDLLLAREVSNDLKLSGSQRERLQKSKERWFSENPLTEAMKAKPEVGENMTTSSLRKIEGDYAKEYGAVHDEVYSILTPKQKDRLKQLWNQFLVLEGWEEVPLTCPEWRDYLELTDEQRKQFDQLNRRYREQYEKIQSELQEKSRQICVELEQVIEQTLTDQQKQAIAALVLLRGY